MFINGNVDGVEQYARMFTRWSAGISNMSSLWEVLADDFFKRIEVSQFKTRGAFGSGGWAPLTEPYRVYKAHKFPGRGILVRTGELRTSLTNIGAKGNIYRATPTSVEMGTSIPYAGYLQHGTGKMVARPPIQLSPLAQRGWDHLIAHWMYENQQGYGANTSGHQAWPR